MPAPDPMLRLLAATELFAGLNEDSLAEVLELCEARGLPSGALVCQEGDPGDALFIVTSGELRAQLTSQGGERVVLSELGPGQVVGETSVFDGGPRTADLICTRPTSLLVLPRARLLPFVEAHPRLASRLLQLLASRLRSNTRLVQELAPVSRDPGAAKGTLSRAELELSMVGFGRYGNRYIGPKYAKRGYLWEPVAVVDPGVSPSAFAASVLGQARPEVALFSGFEGWLEGYYAPLSEDRRRKQLVELALKPELMFAETLRYIDAGVRQLILPKPVVMDADQLLALSELVAARGVKAAVASQWFYSDIPPLLAWNIRERAGPGGRVRRVEMDFSKENGLAYHTAPPLLELPHVLQLLVSCGLVDPSRDRPEVSGTPTRAEVRYAPPDIAEGVLLACDTDYAPTPQEKRRYPTWDVQVRTMKVFFDDDPDHPGLSVDFWVKFDRSGDFAIRPGAVTLREAGGQARPLKLRFVDDQLMVMSERIFAAMLEPLERFEDRNAALSLEDYAPIGGQLMDIQAAWERAVAAQGAAPSR